MMSSLLLSDIAGQTGGEIRGDAHFDSVSTDSRNVQAGQLFVALVGEKFNGNQFVPQVAKAGAVAAVVSEFNTAELPQLCVEDTRLALGLIARSNRRQFSGPVIALTGSAGKTTTKEMIASILAECGSVMATEGNLNNEIGVPLTLLRLSSQHQFAVIEMGASRANDIRYLTQFAEPDIALVTNAMPAHLAGFGDLDTVATTKGQVFESVANGGAAIINIDDKYSGQWCRQAGAAVITTFSLDKTVADFYGRNIQLQRDGSTQFVLCTPAGEVEVRLSLLGSHNVRNAIAAAATAFVAGAKLQQIKAGLQRVQPVKGRLFPHTLNGQLLIDDTYNANPGAVKAAIDVLSAFEGRRCLILGAMAELGENSQQEHDAVAAYAKQLGVERVFLVGAFAVQSAQIFGEAFSDVNELLKTVGDRVDADVVLVKGSRSAAMERVVDALIEKNNKWGIR